MRGVLERKKTQKWIQDIPSFSGKRDSNPRPSPWQGDALPLSYSRKEGNLFHHDFTGV